MKIDYEKAREYNRRRFLERMRERIKEVLDLDIDEYNLFYEFGTRVICYPAHPERDDSGITLVSKHLTDVEYERIKMYIRGVKEPRKVQGMMPEDLERLYKAIEDREAFLAYNSKVNCPLLGYKIYEQTCISCHYRKYWLPLACHDLKDAALLGAFMHRWEDMLYCLNTIRDIKDLALKIKDKIPEEWLIEEA